MSLGEYFNLTYCVRFCMKELYNWLLCVGVIDWLDPVNEQCHVKAIIHPGGAIGGEAVSNRFLIGG